MRRAVVILGLGVVSALSGPARVASAAENAPEHAASRASPRVVLVASAGMEELAARFVAELHSMHIEVVRAPDATGTPDLLELSRLAKEHDARVAVRIREVGGTAVDLWLVSTASEELVYRHVAADGDRAVLVLRSLEILRGSLIDLGVVVDEPAPPPEPVPPSKPPAAPNERPPVPPESPSWLGLSGGLVAPRARGPLGAAAGFSIRQQLGRRFVLRGEVMLPLTGWKVSGEGGHATVRLGSATFAGLIEPWGGRTVSPSVGLGVGAVVLHVGGDPQAGYRGESSLTPAFFPHCQADVGVQLSPRLRLRAALAAGFVLPRPVLLFAMAREESWLNPLLISTLGIEIPLR